MAPRKKIRAKKQILQSSAAITAAVASPTSKSPTEQQQASSILVSPSPGEGPFNGHPTPDGSSKIRDTAEEDLANDLTAGEAPADLPAKECSPDNQTSTSVDQRSAENLRVISPATRAEHHTLKRESLSKTPPAIEPKTMQRLESPFTGQQLTEVQAGYRQTTGALQSSVELSDQGPQKDLPSNPPRSDSVKGVSQRINYGANGRSPTPENSRKRARSVEVIDLTCDSEDESEWPTGNSQYKPSPSPELKAICGGYGDEPMSKRPKRERSRSVVLQALHVRLPDSPESSTKNSEDESRKSKGNSHQRFTERDFSTYMDNETKWFTATSKKCDLVDKYLKQLKECIESLEALDIEYGNAIAELSTDSVSKPTRMKVRDQLVVLNDKRRAKTAEQRRILFSITQEATSIAENNNSWYAREQKITKRIEKSR